MGELSSLVAQDFVHQQYQHWHVSWILIFLIDSHCWKFSQQVLAIVFCQLSTKIVMSQGEKQPNYGESHSNLAATGSEEQTLDDLWHFASPPVFQYLELETSFVLASFFGFNLCSVIEIWQLHPDLMAQQLTPEVSINMDLDVSFWMNLYVFLKTWVKLVLSHQFQSRHPWLARWVWFGCFLSGWVLLTNMYRLSNTSRAPFGR